MVNSGFYIRHDLDTGDITGKFSETVFQIPKREDLCASDDLEDLSLSLLSEAISDYFRSGPGGESKAPDRMQQGYKAVRQLKKWLEIHRGPDPTICTECSQQM